MTVAETFEARDEDVELAPGNRAPRRSPWPRRPQGQVEVRIVVVARPCHRQRRTGSPHSWRYLPKPVIGEQLVVDPAPLPGEDRPRLGGVDTGTVLVL